MGFHGSRRAARYLSCSRCDRRHLAQAQVQAREERSRTRVGEGRLEEGSSDQPVSEYLYEVMNVLKSDRMERWRQNRDKSNGGYFRARPRRRSSLNLETTRGPLNAESSPPLPLARGQFQSALVSVHVGRPFVRAMNSEAVGLTLLQCHLLTTRVPMYVCM